MIKVIKAIILAAVLVAVLVAAGCSGGTDAREIPAPGRPAPDFKLESLDGRAVALSELRGRPLLINFWATWCGPCRIEMPFLQEVFEDPDWLEQGLVVLAVNLGESRSAVQKFMEDNSLSFTVLLDTDGEVMKTYNAALIPTTYFIDKDGIIRDIKIGAFTKKADLDWRLLNSIMEDES